MALEELTGRARAQASSPIDGPVEATIATTPSAGEEVEVKIGDATQNTGPCRWSPLVVGGALFEPARGDPCVVQRASDGHNVVLWWEPGNDRLGYSLAQSSRPPTVTALPGAPVTDDEIYLQTAAMAALATPVRWHLIYGATGWEYVGGAPLYAEVATAQSTTNGSFVELATPGPSIAIPTAGVYEISLGFGGNTSGNNYAFMSFDIGSTPATQADACEVSDVTTDYQSVSRTIPPKTLAAVTLSAVYAARGNGSTAIFTKRWMRVLPLVLG